MASSASFFLLDERIQRFIWAERWEDLRDAQEAAIPLIVKGDRDVVIAAATAAGKTEAAMFPALTHLLASSPQGLIVYISPLKALINDQFIRLDRLCSDLEVPVWPWHGDISATSKTKFLKQRCGVLLITPESLEALLCNRGSSVKSLLERASFFIIDELHAFIGSERGKQLQSLMHRVETILGRRVPRIGLSATLGDMDLARGFLRPSAAEDVALVDSKASGSGLKVLIKGFEEPVAVRPESDEEDEPDPVTPAHVAAHLFKVLRGTNNLIFPNSRREVERYTHLLNKLCASERVPNEFWPHHGNLSAEIRFETEAALKQKERPASAVCTNTLELGIDIGAVKSVAQICPPPSVASLRQRLGRSGRRKGEPAILRGYCIEDSLAANRGLSTQLRLQTVQMASMVTLLAEGWFEPPRAHGAHLSTLIQQLLSLIAQTGGLSAGQARVMLCGPGSPFEGLSTDEFVELLRTLARKELIMQDSSGLLLHGTIGEKFVNHYSFYAAFAADEEFRVVAGGKTLGSLPVASMMTAGQRILFAGKTWYVDEVDEEQKTIHVSRAKGGLPPIFSGGAGRVHTMVRQRMRQLLESSQSVGFLDTTATRFLDEGRLNYSSLALKDAVFLDQGKQVSILTWLGDGANEAIACLLKRRGLVAAASGPGVEVEKSGGASQASICDVLADAAVDDVPPLDLLLADAQNLRREKWDWALPDPLVRTTYASLYLDINEALAWVRMTMSKESQIRPNETLIRGGEPAGPQGKPSAKRATPDIEA